MTNQELTELLGPEIAGAFARKGYDSLTKVQQAVLDPSLADRDLRVSSQTGSGKTVAIGLAVRHLCSKSEPTERGAAKPAVLLITPTRELAKQVELELAWLFAPLGVRVCSVAGGGSYGWEQRALSAGPKIVVATPGRLLDHLQRGTIDGKAIRAVCLDEADRLLDMGFRDDLDAIFGFASERERTHLMSATFPEEVRSLADRVQKDPARVEGTRLGAANADIEHVVSLVDPRQYVDALVNLLLSAPGEQTLIFARTRADVAKIAGDLESIGFPIRALSGDMAQRERNHALESFRSGKVSAIVATDVAARGIDVVGISRVIHVEPPTDADTYTHRSGRTGRAGRKGTSTVLAPPAALGRIRRFMGSLGLSFRFEPIPDANKIRLDRVERIYEELVAPDPEGFRGFDDGLWGLSERLLASEAPQRVVARLLSEAGLGGPAEPRNVRPIDPPQDPRSRAHAASRGEQARPMSGPRDWVRFRISYGRNVGADERRVLALVCRRGDIPSRLVGRIELGATFSVVEVAADMADQFESLARRPDERDRRVVISRERAIHAKLPRPVWSAPPPPLTEEEEGEPRPVPPLAKPPRFEDSPRPPRSPGPPPIAREPAHTRPAERGGYPRRPREDGPRHEPRPAAGYAPRGPRPTRDAPPREPRPVDSPRPPRAPRPREEEVTPRRRYKDEVSAPSGEPRPTEGPKPPFAPRPEKKERGGYGKLRKKTK